MPTFIFFEDTPIIAYKRQRIEVNACTEQEAINIIENMIKDPQNKDKRYYQDNIPCNPISIKTPYD